TVIFSAMLLLAATVLANIGGGVIGRGRLVFLKTIGTRQNIYLLYGLRRETVYLAGDIHRRNPKATILLLHDRSENPSAEDGNRKILENDLFQYGAAKVSFTSEKPLLFLIRIARKCRKQTFLILMDTVCQKNTAFLEKLNLPSINKSVPGLHLYVLYEKEINECIAQEDTLLEWDIHWISPGELAARQALMTPAFLDICPARECSFGRVSRNLSLAVVGYSETAEELCRYLSSCVQTAGMTVSLLLFDREIGQKTAYFRFSNPELYKAISLNLSGIEPGTVEFYEFFSQKENCPDGIFFAGENENQNILYAFRLQKLLHCHKDRQIPIFVQKTSSHEHQRAFELSNLQSFGCMEQIYSYDVLINEELDAIAKAVHWHYQTYNKTGKDMELAWRQASLYEQMSSRALAIHIPWKLKCAGFEKAPGSFDDAYERELADNPALMENLSIGEHLRWNAFLFASGWKTVSPGTLPAGARKDACKKLHVCLVSWEELKAVEEYYQYDFQELDKHFVKALAQILQNAGYSIKRCQEPQAGLPNQKIK
ncbi:MAG: hypothetical protein K2G19_04385, partial [Lachnospiraceae bacterium]|nr:hypothetical protein [Lachnospiraceae bacterium]